MAQNSPLRTLTPEEERQIIAMYRSGYQLQVIADTFGINKGKVQRLRIKVGANRRNAGRKNDVNLSPRAESMRNCLVAIVGY